MQVALDKEMQAVTICELPRERAEFYQKAIVEFDSQYDSEFTGNIYISIIRFADVYSNFLHFTC